MREVFFVIGKGGAVLWSDAGDSAAALPDRRERWDAIWRLREEIEELAHSHPLTRLPDRLVQQNAQRRFS